jgi:hypothetical protein
MAAPGVAASAGPFAVLADGESCIPFAAALAGWVGPAPLEEGAAAGCCGS